MTQPIEKPGEQVRIDTDEARAGSTPHIVRYVLLFSLTLAIIAMTIAWVSAALSTS
ncbi:MAG TPA: hypothetical protein VEZ26_04975 [Sphingomonadaceae bacterium]|nr:hypothetical protein [Sphingomonadaceae bacterium]